MEYRRHSVMRIAPKAVMPPAIVAACTLVLAACGGMVEGSGTTDAAADAGSDVAAGADAGFTQCSAPDGVRVCNGPNRCPADRGCDCLDWLPGVDICADSPGFTLDSCYACPDGDVCIAPVLTVPDVLYCEPFSMGLLFAKNGGAAQVRYADLSAWTGEALPADAKCSPGLGFPACGPACGQCAPGSICVGRSPRHPLGFCFSKDTHVGCTIGSPACGGALSCFIFSVQPDMQALADRNGYCVPTDQCHAMAANLVGGGTCL